MNIKSTLKPMDFSTKKQPFRFFWGGGGPNVEPKPHTPRRVLCNYTIVVQVTFNSWIPQLLNATFVFHEQDDLYTPQKCKMDTKNGHI